ERLQNLVHELQTLTPSDIVVEEQARQQISEALIGGIVISIIVAIILAALFNRSTTRRLNVIVLNTQRLSTHEQLLPRLSGHDELADLDHVFHDMAESLDEAARYKQEILGVVSHDLRSPLSSLQWSLGLLKKDFYGELPDKAKAKITDGESSLK